jgi:LmbE family N-acetylglucosaminyl deacetylase
MSLIDGVERALVVAPHADDEVLGCGGVMARLAGLGREVHVVIMAVDGSHHHGLDHVTTFAEREAEIRDVAAHLGFSYEIAYPERGLMERLDTVAKRELVDLFQELYRRRRPDLLLLPYHTDYDQDHRQTFETAFAAARPISPRFGGWLVPQVWAYEQTKLCFAWESLPRPSVFVDVSDVLEAKLEAVRRYETQFRPVPHVRSLDNVAGLARIRGSEIGVDYAEAFQALRVSA